MILRSLRAFRSAGMTFPEVLISAAIMSVITAAVLTGVTAIRRTYVAAQHHAKSQIEQSRLIDYIARDLRRTIEPPTVFTDANGKHVIKMTLPDFYQDRPGDAPARRENVEADSWDKPNKPQIVNRNVKYGDSSLTVSYLQGGSTVYRSVLKDGVDTRTPIVTDVEDFEISYPEADSTHVEVSVTFLPRFHLSGGNSAELREATTARTTVYLRNKRY